MFSGIVKWYNEAKGIGVIVADDSACELRMNHSGIRGHGYRCLYEGQRVVFDIIETSKGRMAINVIPTDNE